jgi:hypothetical protein
MAKNFEFISAIVCEDVRTEVNGKQSVFGIFDTEIVSAAFPAIVPKLMFRVVIRLQKKPKALRFVVSTEGHKLFEYDGKFPDVSMPGTSGSISLLFAAAPAIIPNEGVYSLKLAVDDAALKSIWKFDVRLPDGDAEKKRLSI